MQWKSIILAAALAAAIPAATFAQNAPDNGGNNGGGNNGGGNNGGGNGGGGNGRRGQGGQRGNWGDPAQRQQMMMDMLKTQLAAQDDEWKVIEPKLKKVMDDQRDLRPNMRGMFGGGPGGFGGGRRGGDQGGGGGGGGAPPEATTPVAKASEDLQNTLKGNPSDEAVDKKLTAYRDARDKAKTDMAADQKDLKGVLTAKQEATLVMMGMLD